MDQSKTHVPAHQSHSYSPYEQLIRRNAQSFHPNFNARAFEKNGALVTDDLHVNSNGKVFRGRDAFVNQIARFVEPFPDVAITDLATVVDGNVAVVRFEITGTHKGDLQTQGGTIAATGKAIRIPGLEYFTFNEAGLLVDLLTIEDMAQLLHQLKE